MRHYPICRYSGKLFLASAANTDRRVGRMESFPILFRQVFLHSNINMKPESFVRQIVLLIFVVIFPVFSFAQANSAPSEVTPRNGLPHLFTKLREGKNVRIAYLGGSITAANGWRDLSFHWLAQQYPKANLVQTDASLSGTGSMLGAFRLKHDVLSARPDLIFVEFAVNDHGVPNDAIVRSMEGIVRQAKNQYPDVDFCFVYTLNSEDLPKLEAGQGSAPSLAMEQVANYYGIPSINFGISIAAMVKSGNLIFQGPMPSSSSTSASGTQSKMVFSGDGTHPYTQTGHQLYFAAIVRSMPELLSASLHAAAYPSKPLDPLNLEHATVVPLENVARTGDWKIANLVDDSGQLQRSLPKVWQASRSGDTISFSFNGTLCGIYGVKGGDVGQFKVVIDDAPPIITTLFDPFSTAGRYRIRAWFSPFLAPGKHSIKIEVAGPVPDKEAILHKLHPTLTKSSDYAKTMLYIGDVFVDGTLAR